MWEFRAVAVQKEYKRVCGWDPNGMAGRRVTQLISYPAEPNHLQPSSPARCLPGPTTSNFPSRCSSAPPPRRIRERKTAIRQ